MGTLFVFQEAQLSSAVFLIANLTESQIDGNTFGMANPRKGGSGFQDWFPRKKAGTAPHGILQFEELNHADGSK